MNLEERIKKILPTHLAATTAQVTLATPIFALYETTIAGFSVEQSTDARIAGLIVAYAGVGGLYSYIRDYVWKKFDVKNKTEKIKHRIDKNTHMTFNIARAAFTYLVSGMTNTTKLTRGVIFGSIYGKLFGGRSGYLMDMYKDFLGVKQSNRIPKYMQKWNNKVKKGATIAMMATSFVTTKGIYETVPIVKEKVNNYFTEHVLSHTPTHYDQSVRINQRLNDVLQ